MNYQFDWGILLAIPYREWLLSGIKITLTLSATSIFLSLIAGIIISVMRLSPLKPLSWFSKGYIEFFRNTPLLIQIFFWYFGSDAILPKAVNKWLYLQDFEFSAAVIALTIYTSAFIAEDIRSGITSIPKEQMEAARASGFSYLESMRYVILPQAFRIVIPPLIGQFLNLTKNSSLAMTIGVAEITYQARQIESYTFKGFEAFTAATLIYIALSLVISLLVNVYKKYGFKGARA